MPPAPLPPGQTCAPRAARGKFLSARGKFKNAGCARSRSKALMAEYIRVRGGGRTATAVRCVDVPPFACALRVSSRTVRGPSGSVPATAEHLCRFSATDGVSHHGVRGTEGSALTQGAGGSDCQGLNACIRPRWNLMQGADAVLMAVEHRTSLVGTCPPWSTQYLMQGADPVLVAVKQHTSPRYL
eukprot:1196427-Prorocentrum_minimum.AAC.5